jgi:hypothetical protein
MQAETDTVTLHSCAILVRKSQKVTLCNELRRNIEVLNLGNIWRQRVGFKPWSVFSVGNGVMNVGVKGQIQETGGIENWRSKCVL